MDFCLIIVLIYFLKQILVVYLLKCVLLKGLQFRCSFLLVSSTTLEMQNKEENSSTEWGWAKLATWNAQGKPSHRSPLWLNSVSDITKSNRCEKRDCDMENCPQTNWIFRCDVPKSLRSKMAPTGKSNMRSYNQEVTRRYAVKKPMYIWRFFKKTHF